MDKKELIERLKELQNDYNLERSHLEADELLLEFINDEEIRNAYDNIDKWYV